ncbi:pyrroline-5-carboxylate reductase [Virgibacillus halophilus]|uniref:Pyrroline-5-carboxylate reductase n=1 Tax=Tigheibacillus halophilus TaxID=361280 RepID=A0ABU5C6P2_9BACI|nr:pyrroline-5-carboxylate reductase [Virgibacillus halophilus]
MADKIAFIGAGSMAEAIISGILEMGVCSNEQILVTNKENEDRLAYLKGTYHVQTGQSKDNIMQDAAIVVLATKPYDIKQAIMGIKPFVKPNQLIISVVAGISTDFISTLLDKKVAVVRAMPNTSASIGMSATALAAGEFALTADMQRAKKLFETIGTAEIVAEADMHAVTAVSGSGPAYIYYLVEAMEKAAVRAGLPEKVAKQLIVQTVLGAGEMLQKTGESADMLREKITSKKRNDRSRH